MSLHIYPVPVGETLSSAFTVSFDGQSAPVHTATVSAIPFNRRWPGHQRSVDQAEEAYFAACSADGPIAVTVSPARSFESAVIRPLSARVTPERDSQVLRFTLPGPGFYTLELDGIHNALHLFIDPPETRKPRPGNEVIRFESGIHEIGTLHLHSNQSVYLAEGALVYGSIHAENADQIEILGRGILDNSHNVETILFQPEKLGTGETEVSNYIREHTVKLVNCHDICIDGITIRDSLMYNVATYGCSALTVEDIKIIGCWRYNSDGVDLHDTSHARISNCFIRTFDDSICVKAHKGTGICEDILAERCVVWCDWNHSLEIGAETCADEMRHIRFTNCDVIHSTGVVFSIHNVHHGHVHHVLYDNIRVEYDERAPYPQLQPDDEASFRMYPDDHLPYLINLVIQNHHEYSGQTKRGRISDIAFQNIQVTARAMPPVNFTGYDADHKVSHVRISGLSLNGMPIQTSEALAAQQNVFCEDIEIV